MHLLQYFISYFLNSLLLTTMPVQSKLFETAHDSKICNEVILFKHFLYINLFFIYKFSMLQSNSITYFTCKHCKHMLSSY